MKNSFSIWIPGDMILTTPTQHESCVTTLYKQTVHVVVQIAINYRTSRQTPTARVWPFTWVHAVLKWLHQPLRKKVMLTHPTSLSHDFLHCSASESLPGDCWRYISPAPASHSALSLTCTQCWSWLVFGVGVESETVVESRDAINRRAVALLFHLEVTHDVL